MDIAYSHATATNFKHRFELLYFKFSYAAYGRGFSYTNISDKRNAVFCSQDETCSTVKFITKLFQALYEYVPDLRIV